MMMSTMSVHARRAAMMWMMLVVSMTTVALARSTTPLSGMVVDSHQHPHLVADAASVGDAAKLNIALYYESYCPFCRNFIDEQVLPSYQCTRQMMNLKLVPYGKAQHSDEAPYTFTCQHGPEECAGNVWETALLHVTPNTTQALAVIGCLESHFTAAKATTQKACAEKFGVNFDAVSALAASDKGNLLQLQFARDTQALVPKLTYVPWLTFNGVHDESTQNKLQSNFLGYVCLTYKGTKPACCDEA